MPDYAQAINQHYGQADLSAKILTALREAGKDIAALTWDDLAPFDEHHRGGREATRELAHLVGLREGLHVLAIGGGIGGPARTLAAKCGCRVIGRDLTEECCRATEMLTARVGLHDRGTFRQGHALAMPFAEATFEVVWTQDVFMNIAEKPRLFAEMHRVLRPDVLGRRRAAQVSPALGGVPPPPGRERCPGVLVIRYDRASRRTGPHPFRHRGGRGPRRHWGPPLGLVIIFATDFEVRLANMRRNDAEGRLGKFVAVFERPVYHGGLRKERRGSASWAADRV